VEGQALQGQQWRREKWKSQPPNEEKGALYSPRTKSDRYRNFNPEIPASGAEFLARGRISAPLIKFSVQISDPLTEGCTTKDLAKFRRAGNYGISTPQKFRPRGQNFWPGRKHQYENGCNFCIRTPFSMILGSLESPQRPLQLHP
jgi:hypothetical protein